MRVIDFPLPHNIRAMALWPWILVNKNKTITPAVINHERIHHAQQKELLLAFFYLWYAVEYLIRLCRYRKHRIAYRNISFEREAFFNQGCDDYLNERKCFSWLQYM